MCQSLSLSELLNKCFMEINLKYTEQFFLLMHTKFSTNFKQLI